MPRLLLAVALAVLAGSLALPMYAQSASYAGSWKLNPKASDDPEEQFQKAMERESDPMPSRGFGRDRQRGPSRVPGSAPAGTAAQRPAGRDPCNPVTQLRQPAQDLVIEQTDSTLALKSAGGQCPPGIVYLIDRTLTEPTPAGEVTASVFSQKDGKLRVERKTGESTQVRENYALDPKTGQLLVEFQITTRELPKAFRMKLVYDRQ